MKERKKNFSTHEKPVVGFPRMVTANLESFEVLNLAFSPSLTSDKSKTCSSSSAIVNDARAMRAKTKKWDRIIVLETSYLRTAKKIQEIPTQKKNQYCPPTKFNFECTIFISENPEIISSLSEKNF
jgi:hypothetical protein